MRKTATANLTRGTSEVADTSRSAIESFLGGRGYAASLSYDLVPPRLSRIARSLVD